MEIALVQKSGLRIKGKTASFAVNPVGNASVDAVLLFQDSPSQFGEEDVVYFHGPGDYEVGGVKVTGMKGDKGIVYSLTVDGIAIVVGKIETLSAMQSKIKEHNIIVAQCTEVANASFLTSLAENTIIVYGEKAQETVQGFEKEKVTQANKFSVVAGKLSAEVETIVLV